MYESEEFSGFHIYSSLPVIVEERARQFKRSFLLLFSYFLLAIFVFRKHVKEQMHEKKN